MPSHLFGAQMRDTTAEPFDIAETSLAIEEEISSMLDRRTPTISASPTRGYEHSSNSESPAPRSPNNPKLEKPSKAVDTSLAEDAINPSHYRKHPSGIECIEVTRHMNFNVGNAIKYLWRYMDKDDPVENLKKAQWYIDDEIRRLEGKR
jgi:Protein of unknwon function (DUF3310)